MRVESINIHCCLHRYSDAQCIEIPKKISCYIIEKSRLPATAMGLTTTEVGDEDVCIDFKMLIPTFRGQTEHMRQTF